jgi:hypothetical protein
MLILFGCHKQIEEENKRIFPVAASLRNFHSFWFASHSDSLLRSQPQLRQHSSLPLFLSRMEVTSPIYRHSIFFSMNCSFWSLRVQLAIKPIYTSRTNFPQITSNLFSNMDFHLLFEANHGISLLILLAGPHSNAI